MSKPEGEVREVPFLKNDMKSHHPATGKPLITRIHPAKPMRSAAAKRMR